MLDNWVAINTARVQQWINDLKAKNCQYNLKNLRQSGFLIRDSISSKIQQQIALTTGIADISGLGLFLLAIRQRTIMINAHICKISNKLRKLSLESIPGERVPDLTKTISDYARRIVGWGKPPLDLINLISKPYTKGSSDIFKTHTLVIHIQILSKRYTETWETLILDHNNMYYDLVQTNYYPPVEG